MALKSAQRVPSWLLLIGAMTAVGPVSIDMYLPGFPLIEREFAQGGVERTMASYLIGIAIGQIFYGPISDRFGRKPPLYAGFVLFSLGAFGCMIANDMTMLNVMRVLQALGGGAGMVIGRAIVRDRCEPHEAARAFSTLMMIVSLGPVVAPTLGGWFVTMFGWRSVFAFQSALGLVLLTAMHRILRESRDPAYVRPLDLRDILSSYGRLLTDRAFLGYSLIGAFGMAALFCYVSGSPTVLTRVYDLSPQQFGWALGLNGIAFLGASRLNMIALRTKGPADLLARTVWIPPLAGVLLVILTLFVDPPLWSVILLQVFFFISVARSSPNVSALALAPHGRDAGSASALMGSLQSAVAMTAAIAVAAFNDGTLRTLALIMTLAAVCSTASYVWVRTRRVKPLAGQERDEVPLE